MKFSHITDTGEAAMVDVSPKAVSRREARAGGFVAMGGETVRLIRENGMKKGDVLGVARIAGIQAAKRTDEWIPLCHQLPLSFVGVEFEVLEHGVVVIATARTEAKTGVEMEALVAVGAACLTIFDMCKAVDKAMEIRDIRVMEKTKKEIASP